MLKRLPTKATFHCEEWMRLTKSSSKLVLIKQRENSTLVSNAQEIKIPNEQSRLRENRREFQQRGLARLPTSNLVRNLILSTLFMTPSIFKPAFYILRNIANSRSKLLNPDINPFLRILIKPLIYDQFCAGRNKKEVTQTRDKIRRIGYSGVILCYGREIVLSSSNKVGPSGAASSNTNAEIEEWKNGNLETLSMIGEGDWLGVKFTGAGQDVTNALLEQKDPNPAFVTAMDAICHEARLRGCRIWIDAEQQALQTTIDSWTMDLMRKYNTNGNVLVYNTLQAYLKTSRKTLEQQLALAAKGNWTLAIKLVRGAYISNDRREGIHDTKEETDESYDSIVRDVLTSSKLGNFPRGFPETALFIAGHNSRSVDSAMGLVSNLHDKGKLRTIPEFGQLQGMAEELGCKILDECNDLKQSSGVKQNNIIVPRVYKCLTWGSVRECLQFLVRRAVENSSGTERMRDGLLAYKKELKRRILGV